MDTRMRGYDRVVLRYDRVETGYARVVRGYDIPLSPPT